MRALGILLAVALLGLSLYWLFFSEPLDRAHLGAGELLVAREGLDVFLVGSADGRWRLFDTASRHPGDGVPLSPGILGRPALAQNGDVYMLAAEGLLRRSAQSGLSMLVEEQGPGQRLLGVLGADVPLLTDERGIVLGDIELPAGCEPLISSHGQALAFEGEAGWEAYAWDPDGQRHHALADGCHGAGAAFTPDGEALVVPGKLDGLWRLTLRDAHLSFMADGNLGASVRVGASHGFRGDPPLIVATQWREGYLQIFQTHLGGGGRLQFSSGFIHHYGVSVSRDGRYLCYAQAEFDEKGEDAFEEDVYVFDFSLRHALRLARRAGGRAARGPVFLGSGDDLVYIADGEVELVHLLLSKESP